MTTDNCSFYYLLLRMYHCYKITKCLVLQVRDGDASIRDQNALLLPDNIYEGKKL